MSTVQPSVSIGLPVYNGAAFLRHALDLLLKQSHADFELILSDNASTDETPAICREYAARDSRIVYVRQAANIGGLANFQFTLQKARGNYFMWAACDDWWDQDFVATLARLLDEHPESIIAFSRMHHVDVHGKVFRDYPHLSRLQQSANTGSPIINSSFDAFMLQDARHGKVNMIYGLMRREPLLAADVWSRWGSFTWGGDLLAVANILRYGDVVFSDRLLWKKTENPASAGSLRPSGETFRLLRSLRNVARTYLLYVRYCQGLWIVQGPLPGARPISFARRLSFTVFELLRMSVFFGVDSLRAAARRIGIVQPSRSAS